MKRIRIKINVIFIPYCNFATSALSEMKVNIFFLHVNGNGRMRSMKMLISERRRKNT